MMKIALGVFGGFVAWLIVWIGAEKIFSAIWPAWFGAHQVAFTAAIKSGGAFSADTMILLIQIILGCFASVIAGFLAARIARENQRAPLILGIVLLAFGLLKVTMSWAYVPIWHHVLFAALLIPMTIAGGKFKTAAPQ